MGVAVRVRHGEVREPKFECLVDKCMGLLHNSGEICIWPLLCVPYDLSSIAEDLGKLFVFAIVFAKPWMSTMVSKCCNSPSRWFIHGLC